MARGGAREGGGGGGGDQVQGVLAQVEETVTLFHRRLQRYDCLFVRQASVQLAGVSALARQTPPQPRAEPRQREQEEEEGEVRKACAAGPEPAVLMLPGLTAETRTRQKTATATGRRRRRRSRGRRRRTKTSEGGKEGKVRDGDIKQEAFEGFSDAEFPVLR